MDTPYEVDVALEWVFTAAQSQMRQRLSRSYEYSELPESSKEKIRNAYREQDNSDWTSEEITEYIMYELSQLNYCGPYEPGDRVSNVDGMKTQYRLGNCQGDGVAFEGRPYDLKAIARRLLNRNDFRLLTYEHRGENRYIQGCLLDYLDVNVVDVNHHYHHWNSFRTGIESQGVYDLTDRQAEVINRLEDNIQEELVQLSHDCERVGYEIIEYRQSDEYLDEHFNGDDQLYTYKGEEV